jgi:hypothetical protein
VALLSEGDGERDTFWAVSGSSVSIPFKLYIYSVFKIMGLPNNIPDLNH